MTLIIETIVAGAGTLQWLFMRMVRNFLILVIFSFAGAGFLSAQQGQGRLQLKVYNCQDIRWTTIYGSAGQYRVNSDVKLFRPSFAIQYNLKNGWFAEGEFNYLSSRRSSTHIEATDAAPAMSAEGRYFSTGFRLEAGRAGRSYNGGRWQFSYAAAVRPVFTREITLPDPVSGEVMSGKSMVSDIQFVPRFQRRLSGRLSLDLNLPITLAQFRYKNVMYTHPLQCFPQEQRSLKAEVLPAVLNARIGISVRL